MKKETRENYQHPCFRALCIAFLPTSFLSAVVPSSLERRSSSDIDSCAHPCRSLDNSSCLSDVPAEGRRRRKGRGWGGRGRKWKEPTNRRKPRQTDLSKNAIFGIQPVLPSRCQNDWPSWVYGIYLAPQETSRYPNNWSRCTYSYWSWLGVQRWAGLCGREMEALCWRVAASFGFVVNAPFKGDDWLHTHITYQVTPLPKQRGGQIDLLTKADSAEMCLCFSNVSQHNPGQYLCMRSFLATIGWSSSDFWKDIF